MSPAAWMAIVILVAGVALIYLAVRLLDQNKELRRQLAEVRADYGAEIARSQHMARLVIDADQFFLDPSQGYDDAIRIIGCLAEMGTPIARAERLAS